MDSTHTRLPAQLQHAHVHVHAHAHADAHVVVEDVFEVLRVGCVALACVGPRSGVRVQTFDVCLSIRYSRYFYV